MTTAMIEAPGGPVELQARTCFERLRSVVAGNGLRIGAAARLVVEVSRREHVAVAMDARSAVFGDEKPQTVSSRVTRLPPDELIRLTVELEPRKCDGAGQ